MALKAYARIFKAIGDENRLRIIVALAEQPYGVCDLARHLGLSQPTLSHHLKILRDTELVKGEREGQSTSCSLNFETFKRFGVDVTKLLTHRREDVIHGV